MQPIEGDSYKVPVANRTSLTTTGEITEVPNNRYTIHDTRQIAKSMVLFPKTPHEDRAKSNYDDNPPNSAEATIIGGLSVGFDRGTLRTDSGNNIDAYGIFDAVIAGVLQIRAQGDDKIHFEGAVGEFMNLDSVRELGTDKLIVPQTRQVMRFDSEVVKIRKGLGWRINIVLPQDAVLPSDADWAASSLTRPSLKVQALLFGNSGR